MKKLILLPLALILLFAGKAKAQALVSQSEAFERVAAMFENRDASGFNPGVYVINCVLKIP